MQTEINNVKLKMWDKKLLPETELVDGKRIKTGGKVEFTQYLFVDEFGSKLDFLQKDASLRALEGKQGKLLVELVHDDYKKQNKIRLLNFIPA